jgi:orotidine-5'-phosphate decarboxylase
MAKHVGIYVAYDKSTFTDDDRNLLGEIVDYIDGVKLGYQSIYAEDPESHRSVMSLAREFVAEVLEKKVFIDGKLHDIGNTVSEGLKLIGQQDCDYVTLHGPQSPASLQAAVALGQEYSFTPLAVTVLTDIDDATSLSLWGDNVVEQVKTNASHAYEHGVRGFICSAQEARVIRDQHGRDVTIGTPAIRPRWAVAPDEQKRVTTPTQAAQAGADFIVVGRPILKPPQGISSLQAAKRIREELNKAAA